MAEIRIFLNILAVVVIAWWAFVVVVATILNMTRNVADPALEVRFRYTVAAVIAACWLCAGVLHG